MYNVRMSCSVCTCLVIDLSSIEPESLGPLHLEEIPLCYFAEKGRPYKPKTKKNKKKWRKDEERRAHKKGEGQDGERNAKKEHRVVIIACLFVCTCTLYVYVWGITFRM